MYWITRDGKNKLGPYTWETMQDMADNNLVRPWDMVLPHGEQQWVRADEFDWFSRSKTLRRFTHVAGHFFAWLMICSLGLAGLTVFLDGYMTDTTTYLNLPFGKVSTEDPVLGKKQNFKMIAGGVMMSATILLFVAWFYSLSSRAK